MAIFDGDNYTQLTFLNVTEMLRIDGVVVTAGGGGGGITGPDSSTLTGIPRWGDTAGASLLDSGVLIDANNNMAFSVVGPETTVGIDWEAGEIRQYFSNTSNSLIFSGTNSRDILIESWDNDGSGDSNRQAALLVQDDTLSIEIIGWDAAGSPTGFFSGIAITSAAPAITVTDSVHDKGMLYAANYASENTSEDRWIPDKAYVDAQVGGITGPGTSTLTGIPRWGDATGDSLLDSGLLLDANNNMSFNLEGSETTVGILWDDGAENVRQYWDSASLGSLVFDAMAQRQFNFFAWDNDGSSNSTNQGVFLVQDSAVSLGVATWDGAGSPTGSLAEIGIAATDPAITITDSLHTKGMVYAADYSANYVDRSIVDKLYVDGHPGDIGGPVSSTQDALPRWNNLTGSLLADSSVTLDDNGLFTLADVSSGLQGFNFVDTDNELTYDPSTQILLGSLQNLEGTSGGISLVGYEALTTNWAERSIVEVKDLSLYLASQTGTGVGAVAGEKSIKLDATSEQMLITDNIDSKGLEYLADYASNYSNRSLVDKAYVDALVSGVTTYFTLTSASSTATIASADILVADSVYIIKDATGAASGAAPQTIETAGAQEIDGSTDDVLIEVPYGSLRLYSDGTNLWSF